MDLGWVEVIFEGSFQCRLATDPDPTDATPTMPNKVPWGQQYFGTLYGAGGTFAYDEVPFDRVIRLSKPVQLRSCLVDPWRDTRVTQVLAGEGMDLGVAQATPLNGALVSIGNEKPTPDNPGAMFSAHHVDHGKPGYEVMLNFHLNIGGMVDADAHEPVRTGISGTLPKWGDEFFTAKAQKYEAARVGMHLQRALFVKEHGINRTGHFIHYQVWDQIAIDQFNIRFNGNAGVVSQLNDVWNAQWRLALAFYRYDNDTLTGQVDGSLLGFDPAIDLGPSSRPPKLRPGRFWEKWPGTDQQPTDDDRKAVRDL
jgi:hypothetical protein